MQIATDTNYEGWYITTECRENKPDDWKPGQPFQYAARAQMKLLHPDECRAGWNDSLPKAIPEVGERDFVDWVDSHPTLTSEAERLIDSLKK